MEFAKPKILIFLLALLYSAEWVGWFILRNKIKGKVSYFSIGLATKILPYSGTIPLYINFASKTDYLLINRTILEF
ncbi:MAG: hypothetical protein EU532_06255 [Promethearchaeota archaeon]|nr:MAG: hypothetical protein EU532_06255 [Candidatus Lokiarchaeota archaeon]